MLLLNRRRTLAILGHAGAVAVLAKVANPSAQGASAAGCVTAPQATEGPYWVEEKLNRSDLRVDPADGSVRPGVPLSLTIRVHEVSGTTCSNLAGAQVDLWHCDAAGTYSDEAVQNTLGKKFLRGYQVSDDNGATQFTTVYPGWYSGRTVHIHVRIRTYSGSQVYDEFTSQLFFDDTVTDQVYQQAPYNTRRARDTRNSNDMVLSGMANASQMMLTLTQTASGYSAAIDIGVNLKTVASPKPAVSTGGIVSAANSLAGVAPGALVSIFGQNLAASTQSVAAADVVSGSLPVSLGGVSVLVDNQPAFVDYVSPGQVNIVAPASDKTGAVAVTVTNSAGVSDAVTANLQAVSPAFFATQKYVAAVRSDGTLVDSVTGARAGDIVQLYGTGFGATNPSIAPGALSDTAAPLSHAVTLTIGGADAQVLYAGRTGPGVYQLNVVVPGVAAGDQEVVASVGGVSTPAGTLLRVAS